MHAGASCGNATRHFSQYSRISKGMAFLDGCRSRLGLHSAATDHLSSRSIAMAADLSTGARFWGVGGEGLMNFEVSDDPRACATRRGSERAATARARHHPPVRGRSRRSDRRNYDRKCSERFLRRVSPEYGALRKIVWRSSGRLGRRRPLPARTGQRQGYHHSLSGPGRPIQDTRLR
jgi:hypothetical protein